MTNKLLTKTVKKVNLLSVILTVILVCAIVVSAIFGANYSAVNENASSLTVTVNSAYFDNEEKRDAIKDICETELDKLGINFVQESEMNGDDSEIVYYFDAGVNLDAAEKALETVFGEKTKAGAEWDGAFITVSSNSETVLASIPNSYIVRTAIAVAVFAVLAFVYTLIRHKLVSAIAVALAIVVTPLITASITILTRIPFSTYGLYAIAVSAMLGAVASLLTVNKYSKELKKEDKSITTAEEVVGATAVKSNFVLAVALGVSVVLIGAIATTAVRWFALIALIGVDMAYFIGVHFVSAVYLPLRQRADRKNANKTKYGYEGAKKSESEE